MKKSGFAKKTRWVEVILLTLPFLAALLIMLPCLLSPQFGFEDDGVSLSMVQKALTGGRISFDDNLGFFRPLYWAGMVFEFFLGGPQPLWFYFINLFTLLIVIAEIIGLVRLKGGTIIQSSASALIFVFSTPIVESFYTNSKPEAQQLLWLTSSLLTGHFLSHPQKSKRLVAFVATTLFVLLASLNKSTFIVLIPISFGWMVLGWLFLRQDREEINRLIRFIVSTLFAAALFFILRQWSLSTNMLQGSYTNNNTLNINFMVFMLNHWVVWLMRGYLGTVVCLVLLLAFWGKYELATRKLAIASLVWMFGWFVIYLPWDRAIDYYLLPSALGYGVFCGLVVGALPGLWQVLRPTSRIFAASTVGLLGLFLLMEIVTNASNAKVQLIMDRQDKFLLDFLAENSPKQSKIAANFNENSTFFSHVPLLMSIVNNRGDIIITPFEFQMDLSTGEKTYLLILPVIANQPLTKVRGFGEGQTTVNRSLEAFINNVSPVFETGEKTSMLTFNPAIILCPFTRQFPFYTIYCTKSSSLLVDSRDYMFGWQVYEVNTSNRNMAAPAVYTPEGELKIYNQDATTFQYSLLPGKYPMAADWNADDRTDIVFFSSEDLVWRVFLSPFRQMSSTFEIFGMTTEDKPLVGDWNCDGSATPGFYRPSDNSWHLWNDPEGEEIAISLTGARPNDIPVVGDWDGDGCDTVGVYRPDKGEVNLENELSADLGGIDFNASVDSIPVAADWGGLEMDTLGYF